MGAVLYRICPQLSAAQRPDGEGPPRAVEGGAGAVRGARAGSCARVAPARRGLPRRGLGALALLGSLALPALAPALPIEPSGAPGGTSSPRPSGLTPSLVPTLPGGLDPAPWASSLTAPGANPAAARARPFAAAAGADRLPYLGDGSLGETLGPLLPGGIDLSELGSAPATRARPGPGLRETLLATPLGEEILRLAVEVFSPAVDPSGRLHVSFLGHGDFTLPRREPEPPMQSLGAAGGDLAAFSTNERWGPVGGPIPLAPARFGAGEAPLTVGEFLALLARELVAFATHPLTLLAVTLGAAGYVAFRLALERARRQAHRAEHHHGHHRRPHHHRSRATRPPSRRRHLPRTP